MKSHDFGQFLFNSGRLNEVQMSKMIAAARRAEPTLAVEALFLQLVSATELTNIPIEQLISERQAARAEQLKDGQSLRLAQALLDNGSTDYVQLEKILDEYHDLQVPPLESMLTIYYERLRERLEIDFPFAIDLIRSLHEFMSDELRSTVVILPPTVEDHSGAVGSSVKLIGDLPVVTGIFADEQTLMKLSTRCDDATETIEDAFDVVAELLNVFTGHFATKAAMRRGLDEEPEPPRCGELIGDPIGFHVLTDVGKFFLYVNADEIFES
ncbi:MAG: hypothetical protein IJU71_12110 [Selenomonadaceae bacterium]|nr:hypothetical protein [Selenomonadaceae bacterium]